MVKLENMECTIKKLPKKLKYTAMRHELMGSLKELYNKEFQLKNWINPNLSHAFSDNMEYSIDFFEDLPLNEESDWQIGYTLWDRDEVDAILPLTHLLERVVEEIGIGQPDGAYVNSHLWDEVITAAKHAYSILSKKG